MAKKPLVLVILDGWGLSPAKEGNAIRQARTPTVDDLIKNYPTAALEAAEQAVGLAFGEVGNSEVGHINLGAGQVIYQSLPRINLAISDKSFFKNEVFLKAIKHAKKNKSSLHLIGLVSNGGVHSHVEHLHALLQLCKQEKFKKNVYVHAFTDGRDTAPKVAVNFIATLKEVMKASRVGEIANLSGRYFAMDRNNNWDRTARVYNCLTKGEGIKARDPEQALEESYKKNIFDENIESIVIVDRKERPIGLIQDKDAVIFFNFRPDRARQLTKAFVLDKFTEFERPQKLNLFFGTMMEYEKGLPTEAAFPPKLITQPLARVISESGMNQFHAAETEKYAHVTFFFNGGKEESFKNEDRGLVPSPSVTSYDKKPEMSAFEVTKRVVSEIKSKKYEFILVNFANADMVGHTGNFKAAIKAVEAVDKCLRAIVDITLEASGAILITADHGNAEVMIDLVSGNINKEHTTNPVPIILVDSDRRREKSEEEILALQTQITPMGILADVAPAVIDLIGLRQPREMTGKSLIQYLQ